jgi:hypothetical protein
MAAFRSVVVHEEFPQRELTGFGWILNFSSDAIVIPWARQGVSFVFEPGQ